MPRRKATWALTIVVLIFSAAMLTWIIITGATGPTVCQVTPYQSGPCDTADIASIGIAEIWIVGLLFLGIVALVIRWRRRSQTVSAGHAALPG